MEEKQELEADRTAVSRLWNRGLITAPQARQLQAAITKRDPGSKAPPRPGEDQTQARRTETAISKEDNGSEAPPRPEEDQIQGEQPDTARRWRAMIRALKSANGNKYNIGALLNDCRPQDVIWNGKTLTPVFSHRYNFQRLQEEMQDTAIKTRIQEAVSLEFDPDTTLAPTCREG